MLKFINIYRLFKKSFLTRTFLAIAACIFVVIVGLSSLFIHSQLHAQETIVDEKGRLLSKILANNSRIGIFSDDPSLLTNPVTSVADLKEVNRVSVWDFENKCLFQVGRDSDSPGLTGESKIGFDSCLLRAEAYQYREGNDAVFWAPVIIYKARKEKGGGYRDEKEILNVIGAVEVILDRSPLWQQWKRLMLNGLIVGALALLLGGMIAYVLAIGVTKPLMKLKENVDRYSLDGGGVRFYSDRVDEIGVLSDSFNDMAKKLDARDRALKDANEALERKVEMRTAELVDMNMQLNEEIEERQEIQKALRESELLYKGVFTASSDAFFICDSNIRLHDVNPAGCALYGYSKDAFTDISMNNLVHTDDDLVQKIRETLEKDKAFFSEVLHLNKDGLPVQTELRAVKYLTDDIERVFITVRDVSENKALQTQLIHSERLVATGRLAASVAHEINSPLQGITALLSDMKGECSGNSQMIADLDLVKEAFDTIRNIVKKLQDLNRPDGEKSLVDVHGVIEGTLRLVHSYLLKHRVAVDYIPCTDLPVLTGSSQQLGQCFMNLINNAVEAMLSMPMPFDIPVKNRCIDIRTYTDKSDGVIRITIGDTGPGIAEKDLELLFEPFYTRNKKTGMGIGLAVCQQIVKDHNGTIVADNTENGAQFSITLPLGEI